MTDSAAHQVNPDAHKLAALDGVRGIAVVAVMAFHFCAVLPAAPGLSVAKKVATYGWAGVDLFFVLSGFLITGILLETKAAENYFTSFYARRILRIFPIYYLTLAVMFGLGRVLPVVSTWVPFPAEHWYYYVFLENWIAVFKGGMPPNALGNLWSLAVEEQFYLIWPPFVLFTPLPALKRLIAGGFVLALTIRSYELLTGGVHESVLLSTITRCDGLLAGAFCAVLFSEGRIRTGQILTAWIIVPLLAFFSVMFVFQRESAPYFSAGISLLAIAFSALVLHLALTDGEPRRLQAFFGNGQLRKIGRYSYGMYVYHLPLSWAASTVIYEQMDRAARSNPFITSAYVGCLFLGTYAIAALSYEVMERRILAFKRHFPAQGSHDAAPGRVPA